MKYAWGKQVMHIEFQSRTKMKRSLVKIRLGLEDDTEMDLTEIR
jgi:hypothetical protein